MVKDSDISAGSWSWDATTNKLSIETQTSAGLDEIAGVWSLQSIGHVLDGLSLRRLRQALEMKQEDYRHLLCSLSLSDGKIVRMVGHFAENGNGSGSLLKAYRRHDEIRSSPGPALEAVFQPIVSLSTGEIAGFEALARWQGNAPGNHSGSDGTGDEALAPSMLIRASEALAKWCSSAPGKDVFVNVNLTGRDLARPDIPDLVAALVSGHGFEPGQLRIELTEQAALRDAMQALEVVETLRAAGAGLILDDFGSGHSSFSWLAALPADGLKVDAELIRQLDKPRVETILQGVTEIAAKLGMSSTAEGIEDLGMIKTLRGLGFDYAQGFAFSKPVGADQASAFLKA
ncbi:EAL domain-containing protein [Henriciella litoralis]|uniref:EAL domain-containing protein n=1 Tax=Henriciella litoralis TaxID=568102 RepID=UPI000A017D21|nr:EAL domain-containing protein [Henriciella litoralis]